MADEEVVNEEETTSETDLLQAISDDLRYFIKSIVPNSVYKNGLDPSGEIPIASADNLGCIKVGNGLSITDGGVLSVSGVSGGGLVVHVDMQTFTLDKTYAEIVAAAQTGYVGMLMQSGQEEYDVYSLIGYGYDSGDGYCVFFKGSTSSATTFAAETEDDYPVAAD